MKPLTVTIEPIARALGLTPTATRTRLVRAQVPCEDAPGPGRGRPPTVWDGAAVADYLEREAREAEGLAARCRALADELRESP